MRIFKLDRLAKTIKIEIPLTQPTGKIRIKKRRNYTDFGIPVATKKEPFNEYMYVEWQISYDAELNSSKAELSTLKDTNLTFTGYNGKRKILYELSEFLYYFKDWKVIKKHQISELLQFVQQIPNNKLIENIYRINKSYPVSKKINGLEFLESEIRYPHLIYDFNNGFYVIAEITLREKQKAVGIQPMLYICFPVSCLKDKEGKSILGRTAREKEAAFLELTEKHAFMVLDCFKIFGMLSEAHKHDCIEILNLLLEAS